MTKPKPGEIWLDCGNCIDLLYVCKWDEICEAWLCFCLDCSMGLYGSFVYRKTSVFIRRIQEAE